MSERKFHLRSRVAYGQPDNRIDKLQVEIEANGQWQPFVLNEFTPGFEVFVYSMFTCQHTYFRLNAAENGLALNSAQGEIEMGADEDWQLDRLRVDFRASVSAGMPTREISDYIVERMQLCPVSKNTCSIDGVKVSVSFDD
jgi:hypothetical protein